MNPPASDERLPVLAIVLDSPVREFFPLTYVEAAAGVCRPLWVTLRDDEETLRYVRILRRSGAVVDVGTDGRRRRRGDSRARACGHRRIQRGQRSVDCGSRRDTRARLPQPSHGSATRRQVRTAIGAARIRTADTAILGSGCGHERPRHPAGNRDRGVIPDGAEATGWPEQPGHGAY